VSDGERVTVLAAALTREHNAYDFMIKPSPPVQAIAESQRINGFS
jgi:hypothetical protein